MDIYTGIDASHVAKRKAVYGHRDWLFWVAKDGQRHAALCTGESIKRAMLDVGTQGRVTRYCASDRWPMHGDWSLAALWLRNSKVGY